MPNAAEKKRRSGDGKRKTTRNLVDMDDNWFKIVNVTCQLEGKTQRELLAEVLATTRLKDIAKALKIDI